MTNETKTAAEYDALREKSHAAYEASSAAFEVWQKARNNQRIVAVTIADLVAAGDTVQAEDLDRYRAACDRLREADVEDDRLRAIARAAHADLEAVRAVTR